MDAVKLARLAEDYFRSDTKTLTPIGRRTISTLIKAVLDQQERIDKLETKLAQRTMGAGG